MLNKVLLLLNTLFLASTISAQITGLVTDEKGEPLPFASIYVQGTSTGTTTNYDGEYELDLEPGTYQLVFQYVGYKQRTKKVKVAADPIELNIKLPEEAVNLNTIEILANAEDPAYAIIRKAIAKRKYYKNLVNTYSCDVYIKGNMKILDAPTKILGQEVGDLDGSLDSTRQGIVYLSESESKLYFKQPDKFKEVMTSSKVSGDDNGFSFNSASSMDLNFYDNYNMFARNIISPIAENALSYYRYKLHGTIFDEEGHLINKIEILPKRAEDPIIHGFIYIVEDLWNIYSVDVFLTGKSMKLPLFDTLFVHQVHVPVKKPDVWKLFSQTFTIRGGIMGFKFGGDYTGIYSEYEIEPELGDDFFGNEVFKVEKGANIKDSIYWDTIRPVPLTLEEKVDYVKKDSIKEVRTSKVYLDSMDKVNNKLKFGKLLFGYTYSKSYKRRYFTYESPLSSILFNTVQGWYGDLKFTYRANYDDDRLRWLEIFSKFNYGLAEEKLRISGGFTYNFNRTNFSRISLSGGRETAQYNKDNPIAPIWNYFYSSFFRRNHMKLYDKTFVNLKYRRELWNGVLFRGYLEYAHRKPLDNHSNHSFYFENSRDYEENIPDHPSAAEGAFGESRAAEIGISLRLRINQKYISYPNQKFIAGSKFPDFWIHYRKGFSFGEQNGSFSSDVNYDYLGFQIREGYISMGLVGFSEINIEGGVFINDKKLFFQDYQHFNGNQIDVANSTKYLSSFMMLPYYEYSTRKSNVQAHFQHHFQGYLLDKIPLIRKLGFTEVLGASFLYTPDQKDYLELSFGLDNIGFKLFRFLRFDVVSTFKKGKYDSTGWMIGLNVPID